MEIDTSRIAKVEARAYFDFVLHQLEEAQSKIWLSLFIMDMRPSVDVEGKVLRLLSELIKKHNSGLDVKVLLNGYFRSPSIDVANIASGLYLREFNVPNRRVFSQNERLGSHSKFLICDNLLLLGSPNWSQGAFTDHIEDSVITTGHAVVETESIFLNFWNNARSLTKTII